MLEDIYRCNFGGSSTPLTQAVEFLLQDALLQVLLYNAPGPSLTELQKTPAPPSSEALSTAIGSETGDRSMVRAPPDQLVP